MKKLLTVSQEHLKEWLRYEPESGHFYWIKEPAIMARNLGTRAGTNKRGYVAVGVPGMGPMQAHRLAWIYMHGSIPDGMEIDHIDGDPANNRIANLRLATSSQQKMNKRAQSNNRSGLKGAYFHACHKGKKWRSQIKVGTRLIFLGYHHTAQDAHKAYCEAATKYYGEFARTS